MDDESCRVLATSPSVFIDGASAAALYAAEVECILTGWRAGAGVDMHVPVPPPWPTPDHASLSNATGFPMYVPPYLRDADLTCAQLGRCLLFDVRHGIARCHLHSCRAPTCFKGYVGARRYCWYVTAYSSKQQPRMQNLWQLLQDGPCTPGN